MRVYMRWGMGALSALGLLLTACPVAAQRGVGADQGVARMGVRPEIVTLEGTLAAINVGPCENTTGRGRLGVHLIVEKPAPSEESPAESTSGTWNIHVGPQAAVYEMLEKFPLGVRVSVEAFRTDRMPADHYVARAIASDDAKATLRDESLRPMWAGRGGAASDDWPMRGQGNQYRRGGGRGWGYGHGYGPGYGRGGYGRRGAMP